MTAGQVAAKPVRVGAIDCGTNSIRLLIAEARVDGSLTELVRELEIVRLGQGVDATGELHPDALARTFAAVERYAERLHSYGVGPEQTRLVATSAARDARNVEQFFGGMEARLGLRPEIISGLEEARLSFTGALSGVGVTSSGSVLVMDIGGGSTELVIGDAAGRIEQSASLDIGSVRLTERFGLVGPWSVAKRKLATACVDGLLDGLAWPPGLLSRVGIWIGVAGTVTTLSALAQGLTSYDRAKVHGSVLTTAEIAGLSGRLSALTADEIHSLGVPAGRADVIAAGSLIADRLARRLDLPMIVSESDILDGIALSLLPD